MLSTALLALPSAAASETLPGRDDPVLVSAIDSWLDGDDASSLPAMAGLARDGNTAAQILLDRIRTRGLATTPWVTALPPAEQKALFRRMDTKLGTTWMRVAAETSPLASAFSVYMQPGAAGFTADGGLQLAAAGESCAAAELLPPMLTHGQWDEAMRLASAGEACGLGPLAWAAASHAHDIPGASVLVQSGLRVAAAGTMEGYVFLSYADPSNSQVAASPSPDHAFLRHAVFGTAPVTGMGPPSPEAGAFLDGWLASAPEAAPLRRYCAERCPEALPACAEDVWGAFRGYVPFMVQQHSPLEGVIPTNRYLMSHRAGIALDAAIVASMREPDGSWHPTVALEGCLLSHLDGG